MIDSSWTSTGYAGGDAFDMASVGLSWFKYIKITGECQVTSQQISGPEIDSIFVFNTVTANLPGDANMDNKIDVIDLGILATNYGLSGRSWADGDFNGDTLVNVIDLGILATNYNQRQGANVPEPMTFVLITLPGLGLWQKRYK